MLQISSEDTSIERTPSPSQAMEDLTGEVILDM